MTHILTEKRTLLTVFTEATLEHVLIKDMDRLGIRGYRTCEAAGVVIRGRFRYEGIANCQQPAVRNFPIHGEGTAVLSADRINQAKAVAAHRPDPNLECL